MTKITFYLDNKSIPDADLRYPEKGNPGVGATQFLFGSIPHYIEKFYPGKYEVVIAAHHTQSLPDNVKSLRVGSFTEAIRSAAEDGSTFLVFRPIFDEEYRQAYRAYNGSSLKLIAWAQNFLTNSDLRILNDIRSLKGFVCVGHEQYDVLRDHAIAKRAMVIDNPCDISGFPDVSQIAKEKVVTYIGALIRSKGFHRLAQIWPKILAQVPAARLMVIGSGNLYGSGKKLGSWGVAEESYESLLKKYLSGPDGKPMPSVHFLGKMGLEKMDIFKKTQVGVPNPTGRTETCCVSALEFEACGIPVVSARRNGLLDTVVHKQTGFLSNSPRLQAKYIVRLLQDDTLCAEMGANARRLVVAKFAPADQAAKWDSLLEQLGAEKELSGLPPTKFRYTNFKHLRILNERIRSVFPGIPSLLAGEDRLK